MEAMPYRAELDIDEGLTGASTSGSSVPTGARDCLSCTQRM
jgi:hypothetical protein